MLALVTLLRARQRAHGHAIRLSICGWAGNPCDLFVKGKVATKVLCFTLGFTALAAAETWVSPNCTIRWQAPTGGSEVEGYNVYLKQTDATSRVTDVGDKLEVLCEDLNLSVGRWSVYVTAYNPAGESEASNIVPFVLVASAPASPNGVAVNER